MVDGRSPARRVHLVYPHGPRISCPHAIGRKLGERLARRLEVVYHEIDEVGAIRPEPGDVLLGHPHAAPWTVLRRSLGRSGWTRALVLMPWVDADDSHVALADTTVRRADLFLGLTGNYWAGRLPHSRSRHWAPRFVHVDLAVDRRDFPRVKDAFAPPGTRRFVYIGHTQAYKNTPYLSEIARLMPEAEIAWIGGDGEISGLRSLGRADFATHEGQRLVAGHDFLLTVGWGDANPATILEAMAWGLIPVCTPESGYADQRGIVNVPLGDAARAVDVLRSLQAAPAADLEAIQAAGDAALDSHFTWDRVAAQVHSAIESEACPELIAVGPTREARLRYLSFRDRAGAAVNRRNLRGLVRSLLAGSARGRRLLARRRDRPQ